MSTDDRNGEEDRRLDELLDAADAEVLETLRARLNPRAGQGDAPRPADPVPHWTAWRRRSLTPHPAHAHAASIITVRTRALSLGRDLARTIDRGRHTGLRPDPGDTGSSPPHCARDLVHARTRCLAIALEILLDLDHALDHALDREHGRTLNHARALTRARDRARVLARGLDMAGGPGDPHVETTRAPVQPLDVVQDLLRALSQAHRHTFDLKTALDEVPVDVSGADLSDLHLTDLDVLAGVLWTWETTWPPDVTAQVDARSTEIFPGVFRVSGDTNEHDPHRRARAPR